MKVYIDAKEQERKVRALEYFKLDLQYPSKIVNLDVGDYVFDDKIVFEYKTIPDFLSSIPNQSVFQEASNQAMKYPYHYVMIEGDLFKFLSKQFQLPAIKNYYKSQSRYNSIMSNRYKGGVRRLRTFTNVLTAPTEKKAFKEMVLQSMKCLEVREYGGVVRPPVNSTNPIDSVTGDVSRVGVKSSHRIRKALGISTLADLYKCSYDDFVSVKGIGDKTARSLDDWVHKEV